MKFTIAPAFILHFSATFSTRRAATKALKSDRALYGQIAFRPRAEPAYILHTGVMFSIWAVARPHSEVVMTALPPFFSASFLARRFYRALERYLLKKNAG